MPARAAISAGSPLALSHKHRACRPVLRGARKRGGGRVLAERGLAGDVPGAGGTATTRIAPSAGCLRPRGSCGIPVPVQALSVRGQAAVRISFPRPCAGRTRSSQRRATASSGRSAA